MNRRIVTWLTFLVLIALLLPITVQHQPISGKIMKNSPSVPLFSNTKLNASLIDDFTLAVMRYDSRRSSENYGTVNIPTPSNGAILVLANMMSEEVCRIALSVGKNNKMETLQSYDAYISEHVTHTVDISEEGGFIWNTESCMNFRKESSVEMSALGDTCFNADLVGECYAQASFNTAVLRLCGFSPEEVFTIAIQSYMGGHAINIVNVDGQWLVIDSTYAKYVRMGARDGIIFKKYFNAPLTDYIVLLENDKYLINFGTLYPHQIPTMNDPYLNMDEEMLSEIIENILPLFNYSHLGRKKWELSSFIDNATPNPWMKTVCMPYSIADAVGSTIDEKAADLASNCQEFIINQNNENNLDQYDKSCYALGLLSVDFPQVYANAAKLAAWTSLYGMEKDMVMPFFDVLMISLLLRITIKNRPVVQDGCVAYSDLLYLCHAGSSVDKAVFAYGMLRNMKKETDFWSEKDLYVIITDDYQGHLGVNLNDDWKYISFGHGPLIDDNAPEHVLMVFNEIEYVDSWME